MARTVGDYEERNRRIELVGEYRLNTGESTRSIAKHFTATQFLISNCTVDSYIKDYVKRHPLFKAVIEKQTMENIPESINKPEVVERVYKVANLIKEGFTFEEISKALDEEYWVIYTDIHKRLKMLNESLFNEIAPILKDRSMGNLKNNNVQK